MIKIRTKDADEAAFFWTQSGIEFCGIELKTKPNQKIMKKTLWFIFDSDLDEEQFHELKEDYYNGRTLVEPREYAEHRAEIKEMIRKNVFC